MQLDVKSDTTAKALCGRKPPKAHVCILTAFDCIYHAFMVTTFNVSLLLLLLLLSTGSLS